MSITGPFSTSSTEVNDSVLEDPSVSSSSLDSSEECALLQHNTFTVVPTTSDTIAYTFLPYLNLMLSSSLERQLLLQTNKPSLKDKLFSKDLVRSHSESSLCSSSFKQKSSSLNSGEQTQIQYQLFPLKSLQHKESSLSNSKEKLLEKNLALPKSLNDSSSSSKQELSVASFNIPIYNKTDVKEAITSTTKRDSEAKDPFKKDPLSKTPTSIFTDQSKLSTELSRPLTEKDKDFKEQGEQGEKGKEGEQEKEEKPEVSKEKERLEKIFNNPRAFHNIVSSIKDAKFSIPSNNSETLIFDIENINDTPTENDIESLKNFSLQTSVLSQILKMRLSYLDVVILFIEVLKITLKSRQHQHSFRLEERLLQLEHMQEVVASFKGQGNSLLFSGLASGILAMVSGISPILGQIKGAWLLQQFGRFSSKLKEMEPEKFFEQVGKVTFAISEMSKVTGQIQTAFHESHRSYDDHMKDLYKVEAEERTRSIEELKDNWKSMENFLTQTLQMFHDAIRQLYQ